METLTYVITSIENELKRVLDNAGIYYRIFARQKSNESIEKKLASKKEKYVSEGKKMQDIIGIRIVFYFMEDVKIISDYLHSEDNYVDDSDSQNDIKNAEGQISSIHNLSDKLFMPTRLNIVMRMNEKDTESLYRELANSDEERYDTSLIDNTYEIQLRTVLSEGWHEVEHDLRYKTQNEDWWTYCDEESRMLNGIYATLETSERAMDYIFSSIAYKNYKKSEWNAMLKNHLRIHFQKSELSQQILDILNEDKTLCKSIFRANRRDIIDKLLSCGRYPLLMDNLVFLINRFIDSPSSKIINLEPNIIKTELDKIEKRSELITL